MLSGSAAGSFADDIMKWQKRLQTIEAVLSVWLEVQDKWIELEDVRIDFFAHEIVNVITYKLVEAFIGVDYYNT